MARPLSPADLAERLDAHLARVARRRARRGLPAPQVLVLAPGLEYSSGSRETRGLFAAPGATVEHLLAHTRERQRPVGEPGRRFHYSDTGFVLLGRILEEVTGESFTALQRKRVLEPAGMTASALWQREDGPERIAPLWVDGVELSTARSMSVDWAGGGLASTLDDLARLARALHDGTLLRPESFAAMTAPRSRFRSGIRYGLGAMQLDFSAFSPFLRGRPRPVGHLGVLGVHCFTDPARETTVVLNFHSTREMRASFQTHIRIAAMLDRARLS